MPEVDPGGHATLAPSAAERWIACPASVRMSRTVPQPPSSSYAEEGTAAHALGELKARYQILKGLTLPEYRKAFQAWKQQYHHAITDLPEMERHTQAYVDLLREKLAEHPNSQLMLEQRVPTGVPSCWGTSDAVIVSPVHVEIVDLKYGMGVKVEAQDNPQLRLYGIGALEAFGDILGDAEFVRMTVFQPRLYHTVSETLPAAELVAWRDSIIPIAEVALGHDAPFGPSDAACRWCPAAGQCVAQLQYATAMDFGVTPEVLTEEDLAEALDRIPAIEAWCAAVKNYALDLAYSKGTKIPGYKVVRSGGKRFVKDPEAALEALTAIGYALDEVSKRKINGIGELEKLLGGDFDIAVGPFIDKSEGSPSLVTEDDRRSAINPDQEAQKEFSE
jgi:hypothetical protein